jgi:hypothetical protein
LFGTNETSSISLKIPYMFVSAPVTLYVPSWRIFVELTWI